MSTTKTETKPEIDHDGFNPTPINYEVYVEKGDPFRAELQVDTTIRDEDGSPMSLDVNDIVAEMEREIAVLQTVHPLYSFDSATGEKVPVEFDQQTMTYVPVEGTGHVDQAQIRAHIDEMIPTEAPERPQEAAEPTEDPQMPDDTASGVSDDPGPQEQAEDDEPVEEVLAAFESGEKGRTGKPGIQVVKGNGVSELPKPVKRTAHRPGYRPSPHPKQSQ